MPSSCSIISNNSSLQYSCRPSSLVSSIASYPSGCGRCSGTHVNVLRSPTAEGILHPRSLTLVQRSYSRKTEQRDKKNQEKQKGFSIPPRVIIPTRHKTFSWGRSSFTYSVSAYRTHPTGFHISDTLPHLQNMGGQ
jgi:hypothetical protein